MDRLRALEVFVEVVRKNGFARAADALDTSPANVTRIIADLEAHLGSRLLNRSSRKMSLTDSGATLYERAKTVVEDMADIEDLASSNATRPRGLLRVNAPVSFGILHLAPLWPLFMQRYPEVELDISLTDRVVDLVEEGYDLAVRISRAGSPHNAARKLASSRNVLCAAPAYIRVHGAPGSPQELLGHDCIGYSYAANADEWHFLDEQGVDHAVTVRCRLHTNNGNNARAAALAGIGIILQPLFLIGEDLRAGRLVELLPGYRVPLIDVLAVYPSRRHVSAKLRTMIDFLVEQMADGAGWR